MKHASRSNSQGLIDYDQLKREVSLAQVLGLLHFRPVSIRGSQLRGPCPVHKSSSKSSRSFSANTERDIYHCFGCGSKGNQLDLAREVFAVPLHEASRELCERMGIKVPLK